MASELQGSWLYEEWRKCLGNTPRAMSTEEMEACWQRISSLAYRDGAWQGSVDDARRVSKDGFSIAWEARDFPLAYDRIRRVREHPQFAEDGSIQKLKSLAKDEASALLAMDDVERGILKCREILDLENGHDRARNIIFAVLQNSASIREDTPVPNELLTFVDENVFPEAERRKVVRDGSTVLYSSLLTELSAALKLIDG